MSMAAAKAEGRTVNKLFRPKEAMVAVGIFPRWTEESARDRQGKLLPARFAIRLRHHAWPHRRSDYAMGVSNFGWGDDFCLVTFRPIAIGMLRLATPNSTISTPTTRLPNNLTRFTHLEMWPNRKSVV